MQILIRDAPFTFLCIYFTLLLSSFPCSFPLPFFKVFPFYLSHLHGKPWHLRSSVMSASLCATVILVKSISCTVPRNCWRKNDSDTKKALFDRIFSFRPVRTQYRNFYFLRLHSFFYIYSGQYILLHCSALDTTLVLSKEELRIFYIYLYIAYHN